MSGVTVTPGSNESNVLTFAAAVEANSEHPLAKAIVAEARRRNLPTLHATDFEALPGRGAHAIVDNKSVIIGGPRLLAEGKITVSPEVEKLTAGWASEGKTVLYVVAEGRLLGAFAIEDEIRPESPGAVTELHQLGIRVAIITGDSKTVAHSVARRIGIDDVAAEVLPADKASAVHICSQTTIRVSASVGSQHSYRAAPGTHERFASSELNFSLYGLIWTTDGTCSGKSLFLPVHLAKSHTSTSVMPDSLGMFIRLGFFANYVRGSNACSCSAAHESVTKDLLSSVLN